jgi:hypothetical protein
MGSASEHVIATSKSRVSVQQIPDFFCPQSFAQRGAAAAEVFCDRQTYEEQDAKKVEHAQEQVPRPYL